MSRTDLQVGDMFQSGNAKLLYEDTDFKGKRSETVKPNQNESISITKLFGANFMQIGL